MRAMVWLSLIIIVISVIMLILSGMYNPDSSTNVMAPGEISAYSFEMRAGSSERFTIRGTDYFTFYVMNESAYESLSHGNFTGSYYANTTRQESFVFTAPESGKYYIVIANVNTKNSVEITLIYGPGDNTILRLIGFAIGLIGIGSAAYEYREMTREEKYDTVCPKCGTPMKSTWNFCPKCRYQRGEKP